MPTVLLDGESFSTDAAPGTWAELLGLVDRHIEARGHIVTGVRFDGLDEAAFREPLALDQHLNDLANVEICHRHARFAAGAAASPRPSRRSNPLRWRSGRR